MCMLSASCRAASLGLASSSSRMRARASATRRPDYPRGPRGNARPFRTAVVVLVDERFAQPAVGVDSFEVGLGIAAGVVDDGRGSFGVGEVDARQAWSRPLGAGLGPPTPRWQQACQRAGLNRPPEASRRRGTRRGRLMVRADDRRGPRDVQPADHGHRVRADRRARQGRGAPAGGLNPTDCSVDRSGALGSPWRCCRCFVSLPLSSCSPRSGHTRLPLWRRLAVKAQTRPPLGPRLHLSRVRFRQRAVIADA
jgi:hypothetical protein